MEFFPQVDLRATEAEAIARGLFAVAVVDGIHERELALIAELYRSASSEGAARVALGQMTPLEPHDLAPLLPGGVERQLFVKSAFLLAWADGKVSAAERSLIGKFARALAVSEESEAVLEAEVKDYLLQPLVRLANVEAVSAVAKKLGV